MIHIEPSKPFLDDHRRYDVGSHFRKFRWSDEFADMPQMSLFIHMPLFLKILLVD